MTNGHEYTETPEDLELLEFFESEAIEEERSNGYWCYEFTSEDGTGVRVSCNALAKSVQTDVLFNGRQVSTVVHEGAEEMKIENNALCCSFGTPETKLTVKTRPEVSVQWSTLRTE